MADFHGFSSYSLFSAWTILGEKLGIHIDEFWKRQNPESQRPENEKKMCLGFDQIYKNLETMLFTNKKLNNQQKHNLPK